MIGNLAATTDGEEMFNAMRKHFYTLDKDPRRAAYEGSFNASTKEDPGKQSVHCQDREVVLTVSVLAENNTSINSPMTASKRTGSSLFLTCNKLALQIAPETM